jgi:hypothetical protein
MSAAFTLHALHVTACTKYVCNGVLSCTTLPTLQSHMLLLPLQARLVPQPRAAQAQPAAAHSFAIGAVRVTSTRN